MAINLNQIFYNVSCKAPKINLNMFAFKYYRIIYSLSGVVKKGVFLLGKIRLAKKKIYCTV